MWRWNAKELPLRSGQCPVNACCQVVGSQSLGHAHCKTLEPEQGPRRCGSKIAVILHRMWIDGTEFNWSSEEPLCSPLDPNIEFSPKGEVSRPCRDVAMARSSLALRCPGKARFTH